MKWSRRRLLVVLTTFFLTFGAFDYAAFCKRAAALTSPPAPQADAIIALTGGSGLRIAAGIRLVDTGAANHLLISGVHPDVHMEEIAVLGGGPEATYDCCVDLGYMAQTTYGNALETARWAEDGEHQDLIIVTSNYHMPRSLILLQRAMPDRNLIPYPVQSRINPATPFSDIRSLRGLVTEWLKWRVTRVVYGDRSKALEAP